METLLSDDPGEMPAHLRARHKRRRTALTHRQRRRPYRGAPRAAESKGTPRKPVNAPRQPGAPAQPRGSTKHDRGQDVETAAAHPTVTDDVRGASPEVAPQEAPSPSDGASEPRRGKRTGGAGRATRTPRAAGQVQETPEGEGEGQPDASAPRIPRRTRTLADVLQPMRLALRPDAQEAQAEAPRNAPDAPDALAMPPGGASDAAVPSAEATARPADDLGDPQMARGEGETGTDDLPAPEVPLARPRARLNNETRPIAAPEPARPRSEAGPAVPRARRQSAASGTPSRMAIPQRFLRAVRRGDARLVMYAAIGHGTAGLAIALGSSALLLADQPLGRWTLGLAVVVVGGGGAACALLLWRRSAKAGALMLIATQLVVLAWGFVVVGPRPAVVLLVAPTIWFGLRMGGRQTALTGAVGGLALYGGFAALSGLGMYTPLLTLDAQGQTLVDAGAIVLGLGLTLVAALGAAGARERSEAAARARLYELRLARGEIARLRTQTESDSEVLERALAQALRGRGIDQVTAEGALSPVAEGLNNIAERLRTLQKDREDRLRLEGALRSLIRGLERAGLGLAWSWPEPSGTMLDELVALLRTQRLPDRPMLQAMAPSDFPTLTGLSRAGTPSWPGQSGTIPRTFGASYPVTPLMPPRVG